MGREAGSRRPTASQLKPNDALQNQCLEPMRLSGRRIDEKLVMLESPTYFTVPTYTLGIRQIHALENMSSSSLGDLEYCGPL